MPTPTDPYSSAARRPFDEDEILAPISPEVPKLTRIWIFEHLRGLGRRIS